MTHEEYAKKIFDLSEELQAIANQAEQNGMKVDMRIDTYEAGGFIEGKHQRHVLEVACYSRIPQR